MTSEPIQIQSTDTPPIHNRRRWPAFGWSIYIIITIGLILDTGFQDYRLPDWIDLVATVPSFIALILLALRKQVGNRRFWKIIAIGFPILDITLNLTWIPMSSGEPITPDFLWFFVFVLPLYLGTYVYAFRGANGILMPWLHKLIALSPERKEVINSEKSLKVYWTISMILGWGYFIFSALSLIGLMNDAELLAKFGKVTEYFLMVEVATAAILAWSISRLKRWALAFISILFAISAMVSVIKFTSLLFIILGALYWPLFSRINSLENKKNNPTT